MSINYDKVQTYMCSTVSFAPGATPNDLFTITGNATSNVYVLRMGISLTQTTAGVNNLFIVKRSAANAGGTAVVNTAVPMQSGNLAASALVQHYTGAPTAGAAIGNMWSGTVAAPAPATAGVGGYCGVDVNFESELGQPVALLSAVEVLAWNFAGAALPAGCVAVAWALWAESLK